MESGESEARVVSECSLPDEIVRRRSFARTFVLILVCAALIRALWIVVVPVVPVSDSGRYDVFAQSLATGRGFSSETASEGFWPPGPSFLFSLCYYLTGPESEGRFLTVAVLNLLLGVGSVALTMVLARRWFSVRVAAISGLLLAFWPSQIEFTTVLASETPMIFFMLAALAVWTAERPGLVLRSIIAGALLAVTCYMRPTALLLPVVFGVSRLVTHRRRLHAIGATALIGVTMLALILPWSLRNQRVFGELVLVSANLGANLWMGNNPHTTGGYQRFPRRDFGNVAHRDRELGAVALRYILEEPWAFVKRSAIKAVRLHDRETAGIAWNRAGLDASFPPLAIVVLKWAGQLYWIAVLGLAVVGALWLVGERGLLAAIGAPVLLMWAYFTLVHAATVIQDRYHFAAIPFIAMLAAGALVAIGAHRRALRAAL